MSTIILDLRATNWDEMCTKRIVAVAESRKHIICKLRRTSGPDEPQVTFDLVLSSQFQKQLKLHAAQ